MQTFPDETFQAFHMGNLDTHPREASHAVPIAVGKISWWDLVRDREIGVGQVLNEARRRFWHVRKKAKKTVAKVAANVTIKARRTTATGHPLTARQETQPVNERQDARAAVKTERVNPREARAQQRDEALEDLRRDPTPRHLGLAINALHRTGEFPAAEELLERHPDEEAKLSKAGRRVATLVRGLSAVSRALPEIPERAVTPLFRPEPGRVLYGVHASPLNTRNGYASRTRGVVDALSVYARDVVVAVRPGGAPGTTKHELGNWTNQSGTVRVVSAACPTVDEVGLDNYLRLATDGWVRMIQRHRPSVVVCASNFLTALPALIAARWCGVQFVYEVRGLWHLNYETTTGLDAPWALLDQALDEHVVQNADHVAVIDEAILAHWAERGVHPASATVVPNGVDVDAWSMVPIRDRILSRLGVPSDRFVVVYAGSMVAYEGLDTLVRAIADMDSDVTDGHLILVGDGPERGHLKELAESLGGTDRITFTGSLDQNRSRQIVQSADVVAIPRRATATTRVVPALKPLEAMAAGKPVLLSDLQVHRNLAAPAGAATVVVEDGSPEGWAAVLSRLASDREALADRGRAARLFVFDQRRWEDLVDPLVDQLDLWRQDSSTAVLQARPVSTLRIALVSDEFTRATLETTAEVFSLRPDTAVDEVTAFQPDLLFVESTWDGPDGSWWRKVGYYSDVEFADLERWVTWFRDRGIKTVFWNKEDPIHTERFQPTARLFDVVLSTDANSLGSYVRTAGEVQPILGSMPFFASTAFHRPAWAVPGGEQANGSPYPEVSYAGTYYGSRYPTRTVNLDALLDGATDHGLVVYDRQAAIPNSPYDLPERYAPYSRGALPYKDVVKTYRDTPFHINVNSAQTSQTMLSRRCMEVAASGGVLLSGPGRAVESLFDGVVPVLRSASDVDALLTHMERHPEMRETNAWNAWRSVMRSHTADRRLAFIARLVGLEVTVEDIAPIVLQVRSQPSEAGWASLAEQSVLPRRVDIPEKISLDEQTRALLASRGVAVKHGDALSTDATTSSNSAEDGAIPVCAKLSWTGELLDRVSIEDAATIGHVLGTEAELVLRQATGTVMDPLGWTDADQQAVLTVTSPARGFVDGPEQEAKRVGRPVLPSRNTVAARPSAEESGKHAGRGSAEVSGRDVRVLNSRTILLATHDPKFTTHIVHHLEAQGHRVLLDRWSSHNGHDPEASAELLKQADIVWCEWGLGNIAWYSQKVQEHQRLVCRVHAQEVNRDYVGKANPRFVSAWVFVAPHVERTIQSLFPLVQPAKSHVVPNVVDLMEPRYDGERHNDPYRLGFVGMVPMQKSLHRALDVVEALHARDRRFHLHVLGRTPQEYAWVMAREQESAYYTEQFRRIREELSSMVSVDGTIEDRDELARWYRQSGWVLSTSDHESFHFTVVDGAVLGARPLTLAWPGSNLLYPREVLFATVDDMVREVLSRVPTEPDNRPVETTLSDAQSSVEAAMRQSFDVDRTLAQFTRILLGD